MTSSSGPDPSSEQAVLLVDPRPEDWAQRFARIQDDVLAVLPGARIEHIGSTAVPGLPAKDVVDVIVGLPQSAIASAAHRLEDDGWDLEGEREQHCWLSRPTRRARDCVLHLVEHGGRIWTERLDFRDLLRRDADARADYLRTKVEAARSSTGWTDYTRAKAPTVGRLLDEHRKG
ncbi:GrpB family protein [Brachybacterium sp. ACRRE]|uniref:GrpB family protein n=1 Tax=Brachybacterium sp. ACRRE TaxID=2918184 RepID=UPI001EF1B5B0|nr:GrpB family protein [Brachybacterium sp. ACRRE]MCG7309598.1 GrpB family protein [Brachybacterium sp. ACRRE]